MDNHPEQSRLKQLWGVLKNLSLQAKSVWTPVAEAVQPQRVLMRTETGIQYYTKTESEDLVDQTLLDSLNINASGQFFMNFPVGGQWIQLQNSPRAKTRKTPRDLQKVSALIQEAFNLSNFTAAARAFLFDRVTYGCAAMWIDEKDGMPTFTNVGIENFSVQLDKDSTIRRYAVSSWMSLPNIVDEFGASKLSPEMAAHAGTAVGGSERKRVVGILEKENGRWVFTQFLEEGTVILATTSYDECPVMYSRYYDINGSDFGTGLGSHCLPDHNELCLLAQFLESGIQQEIFPVMLVPSTDKTKVNFTAGSIIPFNPSNPNAVPRPLRTSQVGTHLLKDGLDRYTQKIERSCNVDLFAPLLRTDRLQDMKATVANLIESYASRLNADVYSRLVTEFTIPAIRRVASIIGYTLGKGESILLSTPMQLAMDAGKIEVLTRVVSMLTPLIQADPSLHRKIFKPDVIARDAMFSAGLPVEWVPDPQEVKDMELAEQAAASEQAASQLALNASVMNRNMSQSLQ